MEGDTDDDEGSLRRRSATWRFVAAALVGVVALASVAWGLYGAAADLTRAPEPDSVRVVVGPDGRAHHGGRGYSKEEARSLIGAIASEHPGASVTLCTGGAPGWAGLLTYEGLQAGMTVGIIDDPQHALCAP